MDVFQQSEDHWPSVWISQSDVRFQMVLKRKADDVNGDKHLTDTKKYFKEKELEKFKAKMLNSKNMEQQEEVEILHRVHTSQSIWYLF